MAEDVYFSFGADTGELEAANAKARAEVRSLTAEMNSLGREMQKTGAGMSSELGAHLKSLGNELAKAKAHANELSDTLRKINGHKPAEEIAGLLARFRQLTEGLTGLHEAFSSAAETFAAAFAVDKILEWVNSAQEAAEKVERLSAQLGASTDQVQVLGAVAKLTGTDFNGMALALERTQLRLREAASANNPAQAALKALGEGAKTFIALPIPEQLERLADDFSRFADGPTKTAAAVALLGRSGADLIPVLDRGREGLAELEKTARAAGAVLAEDDVKALADAKEQSAALSLSITGLSNAFQTSFSPAIRGAESLVTGFNNVLIEALRNMREWGAIITNMGAIEGGLGVPGGDNALLLEKAGEIPTDLSRNLTIHAKPQVPDFTTGRSGGKGRSAKDDSAQIDRQAFQEELDEIHEASREKQKALDDDLAHHRESVQQWLADSKAALNGEIAAVKSVYDEEARIAGLTALQVAEIKRQEAREIKRLNDQIADDARKAADLEQKQWTTALNFIDGELNSVLNGMLSKHKTWGQEMEQVFLSLATKAVEELGRIALAEAAVGIGGLLGGPVGAAIGGAGAAALPSWLPHFDVGAWELPSDTVAMVHQGEMIVPSGPAANLRDALSSGTVGGGGGSVAINPTTVINHSSIDGASTAAFFRQNGQALMRGISEAARHGAHLGLKRLNGY